MPPQASLLQGRQQALPSLGDVSHIVRIDLVATEENVPESEDYGAFASMHTRGARRSQRSPAGIFTALCPQMSMGTIVATGVPKVALLVSIVLWNSEPFPH